MGGEKTCSEKQKSQPQRSGNRLLAAGWELIETGVTQWQNNQFEI